VGTATNWAALACGDSHSAAIRADGTLWTWGPNGNGQLGHGDSGSAANRNVPTQVGTATDWAAVNCGQNHTVALKDWGAVYAWGANGYGAVGDGTTTTPRTVPTRVGAAEDWVALAGTAGQHSTAMKADGGVWTWGYNSNGQIGDGTTGNRTSPVLIGTGFRVHTK
jgi:alpha-tubulin suppressor-like RCC1 family protein